MNEDELLSSHVPRALEMKSKLFGFELGDLLLVFFNLAATNLLFGSTSFRYPLVWGSTLFLGLVLFFVKRGKPDSYIEHLGEFLTSQSHRSAGLCDLDYRAYEKGAKHQ